MDVEDGFDFIGTSRKYQINRYQTSELSHALSIFIISQEKHFQERIKLKFKFLCLHISAFQMSYYHEIEKFR